jgi:PPM family protein phosphatase
VNETVSWFGVGRTDIGHVRSTNQDAFAVINDSLLWVVADGMGGHPAGDLAARIAVTVVTGKAPQQFAKVEKISDDPDRLLADLLLAANREIHEQADAQSSLKGMGTTVVAMIITLAPTPIVHIAHLGDSRAYLYRAETLVQLTRDHTLVEEYLQSRLIDAAEARIHPRRHVLTQALGMGLDVKPEGTSMPLKNDDVLLLCSDGLTKMLTDDEIAAVLSRAERNPTRACDDLIEETLTRGAEDNVTVIVCASTPSLLTRKLGH